MNDEILVRIECSSDHVSIAKLIETAFQGTEEVELVQQLREDGDMRLSMVAVLNNKIIGHILFSDLAVRQDGHIVDAVALAPLCVDPSLQNKGIGALLCREGIETCRLLGVEAIVVLGHPDYYPRFGFSAELATNLTAPFSGPAFMALELKHAALKAGGHVRYANAFGTENN